MFRSFGTQLSIRGYQTPLMSNYGRFYWGIISGMTNPLEPFDSPKRVLRVMYTSCSVRKKLIFERASNLL